MGDRMLSVCARSPARSWALPGSESNTMAVAGSVMLLNDGYGVSRSSSERRLNCTEPPLRSV